MRRMPAWNARQLPGPRVGRRTVLAGVAGLAACGRVVRAQSAAVRPLPRTPTPPALRNLSDLPIGACFSPEYAEAADYADLFGRQFSQLTPEYGFQMPAILGDDGVFDWTRADAIVAFARQHRQRIHGTSLIWYALDKAAKFRALDGQGAAFAAAYYDHILTVGGHFRGAVTSWDVVNEAVAEDGDGLRDCLWSRNLGPEAYIVRAFEAAAEADPGAILFLNDYNLESIPRKRSTFMRLVDRLRSRGCRVGGVGSQTHLEAATQPGAVTAAVGELATLGLPIHISEFDVKFGPASKSSLSLEQKESREAALAAETIAALLALPRARQYAFTTWGARDRDSNLNRPSFGGDGTDVPLLFDNNGAPKPAFWAVAERLAASSGRAADRS
jgi:endo-1,4-beta-xylanase